MVFQVDLGPRQKPSARTRAREDRELARQQRRGGMLDRLRRAHRINRRRKAMQRIRAERRRGAVSRMGRRGMGTAIRSAGAGIARRVGGALVKNPIGAIVALLVVGGVVALRLGTGKSFEQMGSELNHMFLGDMDDDARARMTVRHRFQGDQMLTRIRSQSGATNAQMNRIADDLFNYERQLERGKSLIEREFGVNGTWDMLILRFAEGFKKVWSQNGGQDKWQQVIDAAGAHELRRGSKRMGR
jgi:hypothetical protein